MAIGESEQREQTGHGEGRRPTGLLVPSALSLTKISVKVSGNLMPAL